MDGVVHTLGTLMENSSYKQALQQGNLPALFGSLLDGMGHGDSNPLKKKQPNDRNLKSYEVMNCDSGKAEPFMLHIYHSYWFHL